ncbi:MAG: hypothetical protein AAFZ65_14180, partial [Planctomycetota bacterium]
MEQEPEQQLERESTWAACARGLALRPMLVAAAALAGGQGIGVCLAGPSLGLGAGVGSREVAAAVLLSLTGLAAGGLWVRGVRGGGDVRRGGEVRRGREVRGSWDGGERASTGRLGWALVLLFAAGTRAVWAGPPTPVDRLGQAEAERAGLEDRTEFEPPREGARIGRVATV